MGRIAELIEHPSELFHHHSSHHPFAHHKKSSISGIVVLALMAIGLAWMWPEIQRYLKMRRM
ncbi:MAG TPA: hypothetical protein VFE47_00575 [Tepidisphaeraceae bacterium]|jgi:hypothetical protein|nr:hypothetical protein [Tepidisphaeraceae bacterium]